MVLGSLDLLLKLTAILFIAYMVAVWENLPPAVMRKLLPIWSRIRFRAATRNALRRLWLAAMRQKDYGAAITYRRETVELGLATPDLELAFDLASLGLTMSSARQPREAVVSYLEQAERLTHGWRHLNWRGPLLRTLGNELVSLGRVAEAEPILSEAVRLARTANERGDLVTALIGQQVLALVSGRPAEARTLGLEALEQARTLQQPATVAVLLNNLASASLDAGDLNAAERYLAEVDTLTDAMPSGHAPSSSSAGGTSKRLAPWP